MSNFLKFKSWLQRNKPKSLKNYISGYNKINEIVQKYNLMSFEKVNIVNFGMFQEMLNNNNEYINLNKSGKNMYSATLTNYKQYLMDNMLEIPNVEKPFVEFGWRWATTGIVSYLNQPIYLKIVLDAILINGNGEFNQTKEFKELIAKVGYNKYGIDNQDVDKISKLTNADNVKNIIENSGSYWSNLGLLSEVGQLAKVSDLGIDFLQGKISNNEFANIIIDTYEIPNNIYKKHEIELFENNEIRFKPFKIILGILIELNIIGVENAYLTEDEVAKIIVPLSILYTEDNCSEFSQHILNFRVNPLEYNNFPDCTVNYKNDKGYRMLNEYLYFLECFEVLKSDTESVRSVNKKYFLNNYDFNEKDINDVNLKSEGIVSPIDFDLNQFIKDLETSNLYFKPQLVTRFVASLITKPFVLLNGLSGSGKTKLAQAFVQWICQEETQYKIIPVGADWTNREPLLGYPDGLNATMYVTPDNGALQLMLDAQSNPNLPFFMILDEMNLSHVERYFADFLSIMESADSIKLYTGNLRESSEGRMIPQIIMWPKNLFIIGTVNIDETTYMFSPKVLDRANVIEFRLSKGEIESFFKLTDNVNLEALVIEGIGRGASMSSNFLELAKSELRVNDENVQKEILSFFSNLSKVGAEFGYRTANEVLQLINQLGVLDINLSVEAKVDIAIMQKLLPKLHGSRSKLVKVLEALVILCLDNSDGFEISKEKDQSANIKYPLSYDKLISMYRNVIANGFTSYAEA